MMRKYVIGILIGFSLSFAVGANAEVAKNLIEKVVSGVFEVTIDGKKLETDAVVIEGSAYLPVRAFGEATGYAVGYDSNLGVSMTKTVTDSTYTPEPVVDPKFQKIFELEHEKNLLQKKIEELWPILRPYEVKVFDAVTGFSIKEKDTLYYETKRVRDEATVRRDAIIEELKVLTQQ